MHTNLNFAEQKIKMTKLQTVPKQPQKILRPQSGMQGKVEESLLRNDYPSLVGWRAPTLWLQLNTCSSSSGSSAGFISVLLQNDVFMQQKILFCDRNGKTCCCQIWGWAFCCDNTSGRNEINDRRTTRTPNMTAGQRPFTRNNARKRSSEFCWRRRRNFPVIS